MLEGKSTLQRDLHGLEERPTATSGGLARPNAKPCQWGHTQPLHRDSPRCQAGDSTAGKATGRGEAEGTGLAGEEEKALGGDLKAARQY